MIFFFLSFPCLISELQGHLLIDHFKFALNSWWGVCATCYQSDLSKKLTRTHHPSAWRKNLFIDYLHPIPSSQEPSPSYSLLYHQHPERCLPQQMPQAYRLIHLLVLQISKICYRFPNGRWNFAFWAIPCVKTDLMRDLKCSIYPSNQSVFRNLNNAIVFEDHLTMKNVESVKILVFGNIMV